MSEIVPGLKMSPKILFIDIETSPMEVFIWGLGDQYVGIEQIKKDWSILAYAGKWLDSDKLIYNDTSKCKSVRNDKGLAKELWKLMDEADIIVSQNGKRFDIKKINARLLKHKLKRPSSFRQIDTLEIKKRLFALTSNKLAYSSSEFCSTYKKLEHKKYPGVELWKECLKGNKDAWREMQKYNKHDVLALEELYKVLRSWDNTINFDVYHDKTQNVCSCGSNKIRNKGYIYNNSGKFTRFKCLSCGRETKGKTNLLSKEKRKSLRS